jgi:predicted RND superfamily exporter protein
LSFRLRRIGVRERIAAAFEGWGDAVVRHRWWTIAGVLCLAGIVGAQLTRIEVDNSVEAFLRPGDPNLIHYNQLRDQFERDDVVVIAIWPPEVFDLGFLAKLRTLHQDLENETPYLDELTSLVNARSTRGRGDELIVEDLLEQWPESPAELRERVFANPLYLDSLISRDGRLTTVTVKPVTYSPDGEGEELLAGFEESGGGGRPSASERRYLDDRENAVLVKAVRDVMRRHQEPGTRMFLAGAPVIEERMEDEMQADIARFLTSAVLMIVLVLSVVFRRVTGVVLPLLTVVLSLFTTLGAMALLGIALSLTTEILPPFLLTIGVCYSVHILTIFFQRLDRGASREEAIRWALGHSGLAVLMTGLTTAGGLASFAWAEIKPIGELGVVGPLGVLIAMSYSLVLLPALLAVAPLRAGRRRGEPKNAFLIGLVVSCGLGCARRPGTVIAVAAGILLLAALGASRLRFYNDYLAWFPEGEPVRSATELVDRELRGSVTLEAIVETGAENGLHDPALLRRLDEFAAANESIRQGSLFVGKTVSVADVLKETHQALNENRPEYYTVPDDRRLVAQELLLFENSGTDDLEELVDSQFSRARITMRIPWTDWMLYPPFLEEMRRQIAEIFGDEAQVHLTGFSAMMARAATSFVDTMAHSYVLALLIITPLMIFLLGSFRRGLLSMVPNLAPILLTLGLMGWSGIPLDMSTTLLGGIVIGLAVDDTIHFMYRFNRSYDRTRDPERAVRETLETTGAAMLFTSVVLGAGFLIFTLAYMRNIVTFGVLCAFATSAAFLADITLAPALMVLVTRRARRRPGLRGSRVVSDS